MYDLILLDKSKSQLKKLPKELQERIGRAFEKIRIRPQHFVKKLVGSKFYALRVGENRVILDIVNRKLIIYVLEIGHRKNVYKQ